MTTSFRDFLSIQQKHSVPLEEAISPRHEKMADDYDHLGNLDDETRDTMSNSFTHGPHHSVIDLGAHSGFADPDVTEHLRTHGWKIHDYQKGLARKTVQVGAPDRGIPLQDKVVHKNIGKILDETNASRAVKTSFENDSERKLKSTGGLKVLITTHPYATVGKTSGTSWHGESCMNADTGAYKHKLGDDSANGTHEAFLINHDDSGVHTGYPDNPIARISLKRYDSEPDSKNEDSHTVFRPETRAYGAGTNSFSSTVQHWAEENHPATEGRLYRKSQDVYDDSGNDSFKALSDNGVRSMLDVMPMGSHSLSRKHLDLAVNHIDAEKNNAKKGDMIENAALGIKNLNVEHVHELGNVAHQLSMSSNSEESSSGTEGLKALAREHGDKFSTGLIEKFRLTNAKSGGSETNLPVRILANRKLPTQVVDKLPTNQLSFVHESLISPHHIDKILDSYEKRESGSTDALQHFAGKLSSDHLHKVIGSTQYSMPIDAKELVKNENFTEEHTAALMKRPLGAFEKLEAIASLPGIKMEHLNSPTLSGSIASKSTALKNPTLSKELGDHIASYLTAPEVLADRSIRFMQIGKGSSKHFSDDHVDKLVSHHISNPQDEGFSRIRDHELSSRMLHSFGKKIDAETAVHNSALKSGSDYNTDKLERMHVAHEEHISNHHDMFFMGMSEDEKANSPEFLKMAEHVQKHNDNDTTGQNYHSRFYNTDN